MREVLLTDPVILDEFESLSEEMLPSSDKKIFFEGEKNKKYYQNIALFRSYTLESGGPSSNIKRKVSENSAFYGVIDGDFFKEDMERIYQIDFYSIENIILIYHDDLASYLTILKRILKNYFRSEKTIRHRLIRNTDCKDCFSLKKDLEISPQFYAYIDEKIIDELTFLRYMDFKKIVDSYMSFLKQDSRVPKECKTIINKYISTCHVITIDELFSDTELLRVQRELTKEDYL